MAAATELYRNDNPSYMASQGWTVNIGTLSALMPNYISRISEDPRPVSGGYQYWNKNSPNDYSCPVLGTDRYAFYAVLENPSAADLSTMSDSFDACIKTVFGMNYRVGN